MTTSFLRVHNTDIVHADDLSPILLRGAGLGGWMNMENFITGYPGHEHEMRNAMREVLGAEKYKYFFDKFLEYFFTDADARAFKALGLNCIRIPINYRHFEDDLVPRVFKKEGLRHLDRVVEICASHGIYTIIDLHAAAGGQNTDWHSDAGTHKALFWEYEDFQDRTVKLWEWLAEVCVVQRWHYKDNPWIAGYNPLNEPTDAKHTRLVAFYERIEKAIRAVDPRHILFLDGNTFGSDLTAFMGKPALPNCVYAIHDYTSFGFPNPPEVYVGSDKQREILKRSYERKIKYMKEINGPIWNGEFGPVYAAASDPSAASTNESRYRALEDQLKLYDTAPRASWSIWLWKDIGFQGMVYVDERSAYMRLLKPWLEKKKQLVLDAWGADDTPVRELFRPLEEWIHASSPALRDKYPSTWNERRYLRRVVRETLLSESLCAEYAEYFRGKSMEELDELARSFELGRCVQRDRLNEILRAHRGADV
ncbi:hypothetical protein NliqN6_6006 [Naganishia liquefaciens]|uniref:Glycoside hydrolase family 5 domain-containing protein n=1 Tax=Naganishia liquefaciens TaxID=104408 RepID=A0A8H3YH94_9TREE|nr:hypothetical protein NliqN6_6006 [Naganishia liquefaciens]